MNGLVYIYFDQARRDEINRRAAESARRLEHRHQASAASRSAPRPARSAPRTQQAPDVPPSPGRDAGVEKR